MLDFVLNHSLFLFLQISNFTFIMHIWLNRVPAQDVVLVYDFEDEATYVSMIISISLKPCDSFLILTNVLANFRHFFTFNDLNNDHTIENDNPALTLHKKWSFPLTISSANVIKSAGNCGFGHICWRNR